MAEQVQADDAVAALGERLGQRAVHLPREQQAREEDDDALPLAVVVVDEPVPLEFEVADFRPHGSGAA